MWRNGGRLFVRGFTTMIAWLVPRKRRSLISRWSAGSAIGFSSKNRNWRPASKGLGSDTSAMLSAVGHLERQVIREKLRLVDDRSRPSQRAAQAEAPALRHAASEPHYRRGGQLVRSNSVAPNPLEVEWVNVQSGELDTNHLAARWREWYFLLRRRVRRTCSHRIRLSRSLRLSPVSLGASRNWSIQVRHGQPLGGHGRVILSGLSGLIRRSASNAVDEMTFSQPTTSGSTRFQPAQNSTGTREDLPGARGGRDSQAWRTQQAPNHFGVLHTKPLEPH